MPAGTVYLDTIDYNIGDGEQAIELNQVAFFCDHTAAQVLTEATVTLKNGSSAELTETDLEVRYGILIL